MQARPERPLRQGGPPADTWIAGEFLDVLDSVTDWAWWWWAPWAPSLRRHRPPAPERLPLADGSRAWIRPVLSSDRDLHAANYERLSDESKYQRFLSPVPHLTEEMLDQLVDDVDGVDHVAYYVFLAGESSAMPVAIGRIIRDPERPDAADVAVTVQDAWQGRGIATALLTVLVARRPEGVTHLLTVVHADNRASLAMLRRIGPAQLIHLGDGAIEVRVSLDGAPTDRFDDQPLLWPIPPWRLALRARDRLADWF